MPMPEKFKNPDRYEMEANRLHDAFTSYLNSPEAVERVAKILKDRFGIWRQPVSPIAKAILSALTEG